MIRGASLRWWARYWARRVVCLTRGHDWHQPRCGRACDLGFDYCERCQHAIREPILYPEAGWASNSPIQQTWSAEVPIADYGDMR